MQINEYKMQKCLDLHKELAKVSPKLDGTFSITEKYDGWYVWFYYSYSDNTWTGPYSSANRAIPALEWLAQEDLLSKLNKPVLNADAILIAEADIADTPFYIKNGIFNRSVGNYHCKDVIFRCHDLLFPTVVPAMKARDRSIYLENLLANASDSIPFEYATPLATTKYNEHSWQELFDEVTSKGGEGIIAKNIELPFSFGKRNASLIRKKLELTVDCLADRVETSITGKGNIGYTLVSKRANGAEIRTVINAHRVIDTLITRPNEIIGNVICVKAMEEFADGTLRQPVFNCIRHDKKPEDIQ